MKRLGSTNSRTQTSTQGWEKSSGGGTVILSPSSGDLLASDELSDATLSPSTEPSSRGSDTASTALERKTSRNYFIYECQNGNTVNHINKYFKQEINYRESQLVAVKELNSGLPRTNPDSRAEDDFNQGAVDSIPSTHNYSATPPLQLGLAVKHWKI